MTTKQELVEDNAALTATIVELGSIINMLNASIDDYESRLSVRVGNWFRATFGVLSFSSTPTNTTTSTPVVTVN